MAASRKEHIMTPFVPNRILGICLAGAAALVLAVPVSARTPSVDKSGSSMVAQYGWGAAATLAKQRERAALAAGADNRLVALYGWGAAAAYAK